MWNRTDQVVSRRAMPSKLFLRAFTLLIPFIAGCGEHWSCQVAGQTMYSVSESGEIGSAEKGCSCGEMRDFERRVFGSVDEEALKEDHGC
jgi:hypothetical protein